MYRLRLDVGLLRPMVPAVCSIVVLMVTHAATAADTTVVTSKLGPANDPETNQHWSYLSPIRHALPANEDFHWSRNAIDCFTLAMMTIAGQQPSSEAEPAKLLRRLYLDVIGLPPGIGQIEAFENNLTTDSYERVLDGLLSSPQYGEKWARSWLDLARYSDSNGYQADQLREMWAYRDWVIAAMNRDMPFDEFTIAQLAGDRSPEVSLDHKIATGFHRATTCNVEAGVDPEENRTNQIIDRVNTTGTVWLGTTLECAQCHDHKYDPFTQEDYYRLFAFFNNTPLEVQQANGVQFDFFGPKLTLPQSPRRKRKEKENQATLERALADLQSNIGDVSLPVTTTASDRDNANEPALTASRQVFNVLKVNDKQAIQRLDEWINKEVPQAREAYGNIKKGLKRKRELQSSTTLVMVEMEKRRNTNILIRGNFLNRGKQVTPDVPSVFGTAGMHSESDRLGLAQWLVGRRNPLTARVVVNRWWSEVFGHGLVRTEEDFGSQGLPPTHPKLLDWLAVELIDKGWSMKHIHKQIFMSATYRQASRVSPERLVADPQNIWLSRGPRIRLPAETIRDNALAISGLLSLKQKGPPVYPPQPEGLWNQTGRNEPVYRVDKGEDRFRRGVYVIWRRAAPYPSFVNFDAPDRMICVVQRPTTNTPQQALTLLNDQAYTELSKAFAVRIMAEFGHLSLEEQLRQAMRLCVGRSPTLREVAELAQVYRDEFARLDHEPQIAAQIIGSFQPGFVLPPKDKKVWATWFTVANVLLNLDETITKG